MQKVIEKNAPKTILLLLFLADAFVINLSSFLALWFRFDLSFRAIDRVYLESAVQYAWVHTLVTAALFLVFRLYASLWSFASISEFLNIVNACLLSSACQMAGMHLLGLRVPRSYFPLSLAGLIGLVTGVRFSYRIVRNVRMGKRVFGKSQEADVMLIGAGETGAVIMKELHSSLHTDKRVACIIDDDLSKQGKYFQGCRVAGGRDQILECVKRYGIREIIIAMPTAPKKKIRGILEICKNTGCQLRILPGVYQLINGEVNVSKLRRVEIEDLLGREPVQVDVSAVSGYLGGMTVLVTGGGGSIGSELCRQIAEQHPKQLIIFDIYENNAYDIQQELRNGFPELPLVVLIGSVRNTHRVESVFLEYHPDIVFHAAAHKHVPLMEDSPNEAVKNNVFGTYKTAAAAAAYGAKRFVLISSDKAVNPTNIMGATKRICEMVIQTMNRRSKTEFVAVRFGNVLGSNGSVIPLFKKQIARGGPVTVTHPDIIRYFMTIQEAVSLVLQAGAYAEGGEIFVLDMGEPVRIAELAENLIRLSGYQPGEEIEVEYTGLRPGEKLYEELLMEEEGLKETKSRRIHIGMPIKLDEEVFLRQLLELKALADQDSLSVREKVKEIVETYHSPEEWAAVEKDRKCI